MNKEEKIQIVTSSLSDAKITLKSLLECNELEIEEVIHIRRKLINIQYITESWFGSNTNKQFIKDKNNN